MLERDMFEHDSSRLLADIFHSLHRVQRAGYGNWQSKAEVGLSGWRPAQLHDFPRRFDETHLSTCPPQYTVLRDMAASA